MVNVKIFVEGGGDSKKLHVRSREGFRKLITNSGFMGRMPSIVSCGGRKNAYDLFGTFLKSAKRDEFPMLLVDSEDPVTTGPWDHLKVRDNWDRPVGARDDQAQLMATCMETWMMADPEALREFFGTCLRESALLPARDLERRSRQELLEALKHATEDCGRNKRYDKDERSFQILGELNPETLQENLLYFGRFIEALKEHL